MPKELLHEIEVARGRVRNLIDNPSFEFDLAEASASIARVWGVPREMTSVQVHDVSVVSDPIDPYARITACAS